MNIEQSCNKAICFDNEDGSQVIVKINDIVKIETYRNFVSQPIYTGKLIEINDYYFTMDCSEQYKSVINSNIQFSEVINIIKL